MNIHLLAFGITVVMYIILRRYKSAVLKEHKGKRSSNLVYLLSIPLMFYGFVYFTSQRATADPTGDTSSVLSQAYPSSIDVSSLSKE